MRSRRDIEAVEQELTDRVWLERHEVLMEEGRPDMEEAEAAAAALRRELGDDKRGPYSDHEWGMLNGKLSALRWVLGGEWDELDT